MLKIYGDADETVSLERTTEPAVADGSAFTGMVGTS